MKKRKPPSCPSVFDEHRCTLEAGHLYAHHTHEGHAGDVSWACDAGRPSPPATLGGSAMSDPKLPWRLGCMADAMISATVGPRARFFSRERVDEVVLLLREAEKRIIDLETDRQSAQAGPGVAHVDNTTEEAAPRVLGVPAVDQGDLPRSDLDLARYALSIDGIEFGRFVLLAQVDAYVADLRSRVRIERIDEQATPPVTVAAERTARQILCSECFHARGFAVVAGLFPQTICQACGRLCMGYGVQDAARPATE